MDLFTFQYTQDDGWSVDEFPAVDSEQTLLLVFGGSSFLQDDAVVRGLLQHYPTSYAIGCSTSGEIFNGKISDNSLSVAVLRFQQTQMKFVCSNVEDDSQTEAIAHRLATDLATDKLAAVLIFNDGLHINGSALMRGLHSVFGKNIPVTGGMAGDGEVFEHTWVLCNGQLKENHIVMLGIYGDAVCFQYGSKGGWDIFGPERKITRAENNTLYELDGKSALSLYKNYLGELAEGLPATGVMFPLLVYNEQQQDVVRTIIGINEADDSLTLAGDIPEGASSKLMHANADHLINGASEAAGEIKFDCCYNKDQTLAIAISCFGRRKVLKDRTEEEVEAVRDVLSKDIKIVGFYSYGEFSPLSSGVCDLHNQTMAITLISEKCDP